MCRVLTRYPIFLVKLSEGPNEIQPDPENSATENRRTRVIASLMFRWSKHLATVLGEGVVTWVPGESLLVLTKLALAGHTVTSGSRCDGF
ncbi:hypothetical protein RF55_9531 [Lasius niger]|uniref:Uncharacterized protein n=1 Tax=Lasius niger TaxID=67767 RepID=A0A0J7NDT7_LASNI|nr:hypothetical protein RF55_9594 [Lasius niger]KMQ90629.1 hypothetical protein RF55_9591 [Lasius niger]KMQ90632.1 hypothetical protein RF55_9584 [Lasius niger]KMQ90680.1 hypothetical protein RF55_9531 [Lasius niger]